MKLIIGNKNYSSWSFRVWLTLRMKNVAFEEELRPFDIENGFRDYLAFSPTGKVPVLQDQGQTVWESLAILEHVAEQHAGLWPLSATERSRARCISHEIHSGFSALRNACPMNMRRPPGAIEADERVRRDVKRIEKIWAECLQASGGPFLFGRSFTIADGMHAPAVNRMQIYQLSQSPAVLSYTETMTGLEPWQEWSDAAREEPWVVDEDEVYA